MVNSSEMKHSSGFAKSKSRNLDMQESDSYDEKPTAQERESRQSNTAGSDTNHA